MVVGRNAVMSRDCHSAHPGMPKLSSASGNGNGPMKRLSEPRNAKARDEGTFVNAALATEPVVGC